MIAYKYGEKTVYVVLICSTTGEDTFIVAGEGAPNLYTFNLRHKCACWNGCSGTLSNTTTIAPTTPSPSADACRFVHPEKGVINFSFIGRTDVKAAYSDESTRTASNFSMFAQFSIPYFKMLIS